MAAHQAPPSLGFSRQEHWSGLPFPLQCMKVKSEREVTQLCPTLHDPVDCSLPGSSVHGIFQAGVLEWGAIAFSIKCAITLWLKKNVHTIILKSCWKKWHQYTWCRIATNLQFVRKNNYLQTAIKQGMPIHQCLLYILTSLYWMHINLKLLTLPGKLNFFVILGALFLMNFFALKSHLFVIQSATIVVCFCL